MAKLSIVGMVVTKIALIIAVVGLFIASILGQLPHSMSGDTISSSHIAILAFLNVLLLVLLASPSIYFFVIKPFVNDRDEALRQVTHLAHYDKLTNLANRRLIYQNLDKIIARCSRRKVFGAILLIDLNEFKPINDNYGHDAGDAILIAVANQLKLAVRNEDVVGRFGGDEFIVLINHLDDNELEAKKKAVAITKKLHLAINIPVDFEGVELRVGSSIGVCLFKENEDNIDELIKKSDIAMYQAKKNKTEYEFYSSEKE